MAKSPSVLEMARLPRSERLEAELRVLEGLMAAAIQAKKFADAAKIFERIQGQFRRLEKENGKT